MTAILEPLKVYEFGPELHQYNLDFEKIVIHSRLKEFEKKVEDSGLSLKMTIRGAENYQINNKLFTVTPGNYLLVNKHQQFECHLQSEEETEAFCLYLKIDLVREVFNDWCKKEEAQLDNPFHISVKNFNFLEKVYSLSENEVGQYLRQFAAQYKAQEDAPPIEADIFYYTLAEKLLISQNRINQQIDQIQSTKYTTREELFIRLSECRNYIFDNFHKPIQLDDLSRVAFLSKYHLLRTYKQVFGITPYQQVLKLRLQKAKELVRKDFSLEEVAFKLGFSDRRSFTKAFKKAYRISPKGFRNQLAA